MRFGLLTEQELAEIRKIKPGVAYIFPSIGIDRERAVTQLKVEGKKKQALILQFGPMHKPMAALSTCIDTLLKDWGLDVEKHKSLTRLVTPVNNPGNWVKSRDYPADMLFEGQPAVVEFRLDVDGNGNVTGCHIQETTRKKEFDDAVCRSLMKRAKFLPALDAEGNSLKSYYQNTVNFLPSVAP
jgi:TonB family protein